MTEFEAGKYSIGSIKVVNTPDGTVVRQLMPGGEKAWRWHIDNSWAYCGDHKGPWVTVDSKDVPRDVLYAAVWHGSGGSEPHKDHP